MSPTVAVINQTSEGFKISNLDKSPDEIWLTSDICINVQHWLTHHISGLLSFKFIPEDENLPSFLVRKEARKDSSKEYWTAYKRIDGKLRKAYIGAT